ncbi:nuclear receptor-interacting protein 2 isoform X1 [Phyllopteryx taeniolatus]|uniref:nuclear receptor-interacting protein 2 isoform X1 n=1 Tax=Phyllopteryx taeniolatus TaxID=161469 RepID=UPI002AD49FC0|nr:nuclear receptor-interacting protein 2 isoform X1 [Phyllopteryx taeniolatus]
MSEAKKSELAIRDEAILHQQRRLKQATQFTHKDSADLLPLDGLKRLGTSKDLQPHSIVQRRFLEGNITRLRGEARDPAAHVRSPLAGTAGEDEEDEPADGVDESADDSSAEESEKSLQSDDDDSGDAAAASETTRLTTLLVHCKCCESDVKVSLNTSSAHNRISPSCCQRLGLSATGRDGSGSVSGLKLQLGSRTIQCSALVQGTNDNNFKTYTLLKSFKTRAHLFPQRGRVERAEPRPAHSAPTQMLSGPEPPGLEARGRRRGASLLE